MNIAVVIPTLNEGDSIKTVIESVPEMKDMDIKIYIVDGGSSDGTQREAKEAGAIVIEEPRKGYGRAYRTAFEKINTDIYVTLDGDNSYPAGKIPMLVNRLVRGKYDFISGFREPIKDSMHYSHKLGNFGLTFLTNMIFGVHIKDSQSGMWAFTKEILKKMNLKEDGMSFSTEIKLEAYKNGRFKEIHIPLKPRTGKPKIRIIDGFKIAKFLLKKRLGIDH